MDIATHDSADRRILAPRGVPLRWALAAAAVFGLLATGAVGAGNPIGASSLLGALGTRAAPHAGAPLGDLERAAARAPSAANVGSLVGAYLDRDQPGLAQATLERAPAEVRSTAAVQHLEARVRLRRGQSRVALALARQAERTCQRAEAEGACPPHLVAKNLRHLGFLEELVAAGIDDPRADPVAARAAFDRSTREARLVAMR